MFLLLAGAVMTAPSAAAAQMPGLPVLQNAFSNPGITVGGNFGSGSGTTGYGAAVAWAPSSGAFQLSAGIGAASLAKGAGTMTTYGVRASVPLRKFFGGAIGIAPFLGAGAGSKSGTTLSSLPVGAGIGYRHALGSTRAISIYGAPMYNWVRASAGGVTTTAGLFRASVAADITLFARMGATVGAEFGSTPAAGKPGPGGTIIGAGLSYAFSR